MALACADGSCDLCRGYSRDLINEHLGEVTTQLELKFCGSECRDAFVRSMIEGDRIDAEHKTELLARFPHVGAGAAHAPHGDKRIEAHISPARHHQSHKAGTMVATSAPQQTTSLVGASLLTSLKRKVSSKLVVDLNRIVSILTDMANYYADKLDTSEAEIVKQASTVMASVLGRIAENGYSDTDRAKDQLWNKMREALRLEGLSQDFFPNETARQAKVPENPSLRIKELGQELAVLFSRSADPRKTNDINQAQLTLDILTVVHKVIQNTGEHGYLFLQIFPLDVRRIRVVAEEGTKQ